LGITSGYYYWLGLTKTGSSWKWETEGDAEWTLWYPGEPSRTCTYGPPCNCAAIYYLTMDWIDACCDTRAFTVLCEANPIKSP
jgi:hypothetical protein